MCGRFVLEEQPGRLARSTGLATDDAALREVCAEPRYNIAPSQAILGIREDGGRRGAVLRWGLVPFWADDPKVGNRVIDARAETVFDKPAYRVASR